MRSLHLSYPTNTEREAHSIQTPSPPLVDEHDVKEREEKERVDGERYSPTSTYSPPPYVDAEHDVKVKHDSVNWNAAELSVA